MNILLKLKKYVKQNCSKLFLQVKTYLINKLINWFLDLQLKMEKWKHIIIKKLTKSLDAHLRKVADREHKKQLKKAQQKIKSEKKKW